MLTYSISLIRYINENIGVSLLVVDMWGLYTDVGLKNNYLSNLLG